MTQISVALAALLAFSLNLSCTKKTISDAESSDESTPEVAFIQLEKQELFDFLNFSGVLSPKSQESVYASLSGKVRDLHVHDGSMVHKGQHLLSIKPDSEGFEFNVHLVKAPRAGTIFNKLAKIGIHVDKNQELLSIADLSSFRIEVAATADDLPFLKKNELVEIELSPSQKVKGSIHSLAGVPDPKSKTFTVTIEVPCSKEACQGVYAGLLANVLVKKNPHMGFRLPFKYLRRQKDHILVVNDNNTVSFVPVKVGQHYGQDVEILSGITPQTKIVTSFSSMPQEGETVKIAKPTASTPESSSNTPSE